MNIKKTKRNKTINQKEKERNRNTKNDLSRIRNNFKKNKT